MAESAVSKLVEHWRAEAAQKRTAGAAYDGQGKREHRDFAFARARLCETHARELEAALAADSKAKGVTDTYEADLEAALQDMEEGATDGN